MIGEKELTLDTSVIIKGMIPPKRRDEKSNERIRKFETATTYMRFVLFSPIHLFSQMTGNCTTYVIKRR